MSSRIAINGYGRIGRNVLRALYESERFEGMKIVAINDPADVQTHAHLTRHDTVHGAFPGTIEVADDALRINDHRIQVLHELDPAGLPWEELDIDVVIEATGRFASRDKAAAHLQAGARKVLISAPAGDDVPTVVYGVNHAALDPDATVVSNASCTTNALAPLVQPLHAEFDIQYGQMNTIHSATNDQVVTDFYHKDPRRARSASHNIIPTSSGAARSIGLVLPQLEGKLDGFAVRVPTINVSLIDLTLQTARPTTAEAVNAVLRAAAAHGPLAEVLDYTQAPLVSSDYNHNAVSATVDALLTQVLGGHQIKVCAWYDNEWGFSNRMLDAARVMSGAG